MRVTYRSVNAVHGAGGAPGHSPGDEQQPLMGLLAAAPTWRTGKHALAEAKRRGSWPDGALIGCGHPSPYIRAEYATAIANGLKTVEGRPGGGFLAKGIAKNDYINFKVGCGAMHCVVGDEPLHEFLPAVPRTPAQLSCHDVHGIMRQAQAEEVAPPTILESLEHVLVRVVGTIRLAPWRQLGPDIPTPPVSHRLSRPTVAACCAPRAVPPTASSRGANRG